jgi:serine/threonine-protein kinase
VSVDILTRLQSALSGRYEVRRELGRGGMGQVFEARDLKHGRSVAIKILDPELAAAIGSARFRAEIETAARLVHPHIVPLFDSGEADGLFYFVMPLLGGESLRQRLIRERQLPIEDATRIAREVADALRYAHEQGLVHRDVKPDNIVLTGGHAMVLDFGIARTGEAAQSPETRTVAAVGTPAYMSPEQSSGTSLDGRADQYALACVVYEMLTGQPPFTGPTGESVLLQHRTVDPRPATALRPTTPPPVARALSRALAKAPADRYPTMTAFSEALLASTTPGTPSAVGRGRYMLAVLPLENLSADAEQEYFADGMTEELIAHLGRIQPKRLGVIARTSAMRYKKTTKSADEIGRELGVEYLLEGSVRRAGDRIRITTQLVQVSDQSHLWAETYDRRLADIFELQDEVATAVAKALEVELVSSGKARAAEPEAANSDAYEAYLKGRFYWNKRTPESLRLAIEWFGRAIQADPSYARAYAGIADVYNVQVTYLQVPAHEAYPKCERAARRAVELEPNLVEGHASLAGLLTHTGRLDEAQVEFGRALERDPAYVPAHYWNAVLFAARGRFEEALGLIQRARLLDPLSVTVEISHGNILFFARRAEEAVSHYERGVELEPKMAWLHVRLACCRAATGRLEQALAGLKGVDPSLSGTLDLISARAYLLGRLGRSEEARALIRELEERSDREYVSWEHFAYAYAGVDDRVALVGVLSWAPKAGIIGRLFLTYDPAFDPFREDPRFRDFLPGAPGLQ